jgi:hypothetical protein
MMNDGPRGNQAMGDDDQKEADANAGGSNPVVIPAGQQTGAGVQKPAQAPKYVPVDPIVDLKEFRKAVDSARDIDKEER